VALLGSEAHPVGHPVRPRVARVLVPRGRLVGSQVQTCGGARRQLGVSNHLRSTDWVGISTQRLSQGRTSRTWKCDSG